MDKEIINMSLKLTAKQVEEIVYENSDNFKQIEVIEGEDGRWSATDTVIFQDLETSLYYTLYYERGLTENQEDSFGGQTAKNVVQIEETVVIKKWIPAS